MSFLGAFAVLRNTNSFVMTVLRSVSVPIRMEQLGSHWTDFHKILGFFEKPRKTAEKIKT